MYTCVTVYICAHEHMFPVHMCDACACAHEYVCPRAHVWCVSVYIWVCVSMCVVCVCARECVSMCTCACTYVDSAHWQQDQSWPSLDGSQFPHGRKLAHQTPSPLPWAFTMFLQAILALPNSRLSTFMTLIVAPTQGILYWLFPKIFPGFSMSHCVALVPDVTGELVTSK